MSKLRGLILTTFFVCCAFSSEAAEVALSHTSTSPVSTYQLDLIWEIGRGPDPLYSLPDAELLSIPANLYGATLDYNGSLLLFDRISERLIAIDPSGEQRFAVGERGDGPEDHRGSGEPLLLSSDRIGLSDCSVGSKVIVYDGLGTYLETIPLEGFSEVNRVWAIDDDLLALVMERTGSPKQGMNVAVYLVRMDQNGIELARTLLREAVIPGFDLTNPPREEDFWIIPRVEVGSTGFVFIQADLYSNTVECLAPDFSRVWSLDGPWRAPKRSEAELDALSANSGIQWSDNLHSISRVVPRAGATVWVGGKENSSSGSGELLLDLVGEDGVVQGKVRLVGLPYLPGDFRVVGDFVLWKTEDQHWDDGIDSVPYFRVYKLRESD